jgi:hypothetical protein
MPVRAAKEINTMMIIGSLVVSASVRYVVEHSIKSGVVGWMLCKYLLGKHLVE